MGKNWYERNILPHLIEIAGRSLREQREKTVPLVGGLVLEIGFGTGLNLPYYQRSAVKKVFGLDPVALLPVKAGERIARSGMDVEIVRAGAENIPFDDRTFDSVLMTYTLCSIPDPAAALREIRRVLKPGGRLVFSEHGLAPEQKVRRWQNALTPCWGKISGGCHLNRDVPALLKEASFECGSIHAEYISPLRLVSYNYRGWAVKE